MSARRHPCRALRDLRFDGLPSLRQPESWPLQRHIENKKLIVFPFSSLLCIFACPLARRRVAAYGALFRESRRIARRPGGRCRKDVVDFCALCDCGAGSLALRIIPLTDLRSATSVFALGPLSAIRSLVMIVGVVYGAAPSRLAETKLLGAFVLLLMLSMEIVLNFLAQARQIGDLLPHQNR